MGASRREFLEQLARGAALWAGGSLLAGCGRSPTVRIEPVSDALPALETLPAADRMPAIFLGHGSPMNVLADNAFTRDVRALGEALPRPKAVLCVSAHWETPGTFFCTAEHPKTIYDFGGFPPELYAITYPCPGAPQVAEDVIAAHPKDGFQTDDGLLWGLDHGAWSVLYHLFPKADVPVLQISLNQMRTPAEHYEIGKRLAFLREKGVLILGSGNLVHNLGRMRNGQPEDWALAFDSDVAALLMTGNHDALIHYENLGMPAKLSHPTNEHYLPLLYAIAAQDGKDTVSFPHESFQGGGCSMRCVRIG